MNHQNLPSKSSDSTSLLPSSPTSLPQSILIPSTKLAQALESFGPDYRDLVFNRYKEAPRSLIEAASKRAPNFHNVTAFFGEDATKFWLRFHIAETFAFLGIYDTASKLQVQQTADLILTHEIYGQLTLREFLAFLQRFKRGDYGRIYQSSRPNPQEFLACLKPFWQDLSAERARAEQAKRLAQEHRDSRPLTPEEQTRLAEIKQRLSEKFHI